MAIKEASITIMVKDMDRSILFYESIGFAVKKRWADHYAQLAVPGMTIGLHPASDVEAASEVGAGGEGEAGGAGTISIGLTSDNFDEEKAHLDRLSIPVSTRKEEGGEFLHFSDPDGVALYFIKPKW